MSDTNNSPKITIIIPTYNGKKYISETIESVVNQTWQNWELILIDDGSEDDTCDIIAAIEDPRIHLYKAGRTGVIGPLLNMGLQNASGDFIAFSGHDDLWAKTKLAKQVEALRNYPEAGFCLTGGYNFKKLNEPLEYFYKQKEGVRFDNLFTACFKSEVAGFIQALMFRRECITHADFLKGDNSLSDTNFIINLAQRFKGVILYEPLFFRRLHDTNYSSKNWEKLQDEGFNMIRSYKDSLPSDVYRNALFRSHINSGEKYLKHGTKRKALSSFFNGWMQKPFSFIPLKKISKTLIHYLKGK